VMYGKDKLVPKSCHNIQPLINNYTRDRLLKLTGFIPMLVPLIIAESWLTNPRIMDYLTSRNTLTHCVLLAKACWNLDRWLECELIPALFDCPFSSVPLSPSLIEPANRNGVSIEYKWVNVHSFCSALLDLNLIGHVKVLQLMLPG